MKFFGRITLLLCLMVVFSTTAFAYIDPSVTTYAIQAIAGIVIAVGAGVGIYWRKVKRKAMDKLGMDENVKKEVEDDIIEFVDDKNI